MTIIGHLRSKLKPPFKVGIRTQLIALVCVVALLSLVILAVTTGVYFTANYKSLRADRLHVAAQLKSSQIDQNLNYLYYQCYWLSTRDTLQDSLIRYRAGNTTKENWSEAEIVLEKFLGSSDLFSVARIYDSTFKTVLNATNNGSGNLVPEHVLTNLFPLSTDDPLASSLQTSGILTDPVLNDTVYVMSMSLPIFASPSIMLTNSEISGYITVVMSAESLKIVFNDTTALDKSDVAILSAEYSNQSLPVSYHFVFPPHGVGADIIDYSFTIENGSFIQSAFDDRKSGSVKRTSFFYGKDVAVGYSPCLFKQVQWVAVISQPENVFLSPSTRLTNIIIGTALGIAVFMCLVTFPLAHWAVKPIVRLQKATEIITARRGLRSYNQSAPASRTNSFRKRPSTSSSIGSVFRTITDRPHERDNGHSNFELHHRTSNSVDSQEARMDLEISGALPDTNPTTPTSYTNDQHSYKSDNFVNSTNLIDARVPVYGRLFSDELSELTDTFNTMTDELDRHYALLEDRVRARTKQLEAAKIEAEAANEAKTVFIANISHELRTPLNGILGMTAISMAEKDMQKVQNSLKLIFRSGELLLHILTELLTFSKNVLQRTKLEERNFAIMDVALQVKSIFGKLAKDQHVNLSIILSPNVIRTMILWGDPNRIIQIVMNLVSNALKFSPVDGKVGVRIKLLGEYDGRRSEDSNYNDVFIRPGTEIPDASASKSSLSTLEYTKVDAIQRRLASKSSDSQKLKEEPIASSDVSSSDGKDESEADTDTDTDKRSNSEISDSVSLVSSNNSSYDDAILHAQLRKVPSCGNGEDSGDSLGRKLEVSKTWVIAIEVEDTGPGIDPALHESVFEPFVQGDQTLSRQYGGTGLGLSICRQLAKMMKGTMKLESKVGVGSKFTFTVPLTQTREVSFDDVENPFEDEFNAHSKKNRKVKFKMNKNSGGSKSRPSVNTSLNSGTDSTAEKMALSESEVSVGSVRVDRPFLQSTGTATSTRSITTVKSLERPFKILVAEDNNVNQEVVKRMLNLEGLSDIDLACDGQEAFDKVKALQEANDHYRIIFMDVQMPRVDGLLSTKMIRQELRYSHPIVALTAFADDSNIKVCLDSGMNGFLSKPIKRPKLKSVLSEFCPDFVEKRNSNKAK